MPLGSLHRLACNCCCLRPCTTSISGIRSSNVPMFKGPNLKHWKITVLNEKYSRHGLTWEKTESLLQWKNGRKLSWRCVCSGKKRMTWQKVLPIIWWCEVTHTLFSLSALQIGEVHHCSTQASRNWVQKLHRIKNYQSPDDSNCQTKMKTMADNWLELMLHWS